MAPKEISNIKFADIKTAIVNYLKLKTRLTIAERTRFSQAHQKDMKSAQDWLARLRKESQYCDFQSFRTCADLQEEMIRVAFVAGLHNKAVQEKVVEKLLASPDFTMEQLKEFVQQYEEMKKFLYDEEAAVEIHAASGQ